MNVVILAAGKGKRMHSDLPKVLHPIGGRPMLSLVIDAARALSPTRLVVVYGHGGETVRDAIGAAGVTWVLQEPQLGTGHAVLQALPHLDPSRPTIVLYGDVPLLRPAPLLRLAEMAADDSLAVLTVCLEHPKGYGRIVRVDGAIRRIVEKHRVRRSA